MAKEHRLFRFFLSSVFVFLLAAGYVLTSANAATAEKLMNAPKVTKTPTPSESEQVQISAALSAINKAQKAKGCNFNLTAEEVATSAGKCTVLVVGDSLGNNLAYGMQRQLQKTAGIDLVIKSKSSTGLSNSWFYNWPKEIKPFIDDADPDLVIVMLGTNDHQNMKINGQVSEFGSKKWNAKYEAEAAKLISQSIDSGAYVVWVGLPIMQSSYFASYMSVLNDRSSSAVEATDGATFIPTWDLMADSRGKYRDWAKVNGKNQKIRGTDGIHFTWVGQNVLATYVISELQDIFNVKVKSKGQMLFN
ncbi:MAG: hypothetical protein RLZZ330_31 [Actinomycetota bacterium]|jgi:hypothetical protein